MSLEHHKRAGELSAGLVRENFEFDKLLRFCPRLLRSFCLVRESASETPPDERLLLHCSCGRFAGGFSLTEGVYERRMFVVVG